MYLQYGRIFRRESTLLMSLQYSLLLVMFSKGKVGSTGRLRDDRPRCSKSPRPRSRAGNSPEPQRRRPENRPDHRRSPDAKQRHKSSEGRARSPWRLTHFDDRRTSKSRTRSPDKGRNRSPPAAAASHRGRARSPDRRPHWRPPSQTNARQTSFLEYRQFYLNKKKYLQNRSI